MQTESPESDAYPVTARTTLKRLAYRGTHDRAVVHAILDEGLVCHVAFNVDGRPALIPTAYARQGERLLLHGSPGNRILRALAGHTAGVWVARFAPDGRSIATASSDGTVRVWDVGLIDDIFNVVIVVSLIASEFGAFRQIKNVKLQSTCITVIA